MKKYLSVLMLIARNSLYKVLTVCGVNCLVQCTAYLILVKKYLERTADVYVSGGLEHSFVIAKTPIICAVGFIVVCVFLAKTGCEFSAKSGYTLNRLSVSEKSIFVIRSVYNLMILISYWAFNLGIAFILMKLYGTMSPIAKLTNQSVFIAFYRSGYLHGLLPLADKLRWCADVISYIALAMLLSRFPYKQRRGKVSIAVIFFIVLFISVFAREMGSIPLDWGIILYALYLIGYTISDVFKKEFADENQN